jgi:hypothetical protein
MQLIPGRAEVTQFSAHAYKVKRSSTVDSPTSHSELLFTSSFFNAQEGTTKFLLVEMCLESQ